MSVWCETSDEREARAAKRKGDRLERLWAVTYTEWREVKKRGEQA